MNLVNELDKSYTREAFIRTTIEKLGGRAAFDYARRIGEKQDTNRHIPIRLTDYNAPLKFRNGKVISSHTLLSMWLLIHAGIKVNPC